MSEVLSRRALNRALLVVLRYFGAFGPASATDVATWSPLTASAPCSTASAPCYGRSGTSAAASSSISTPPRGRIPTRRLRPASCPKYDNVLLSHADRSRVISDEDRAALLRAGGVGWGSVLVDGFARAVWRVERGTLLVHHLPVTKRAAAAVAAEGRRLIGFLATGKDAHEVHLVAVD